MFGGAGEAIAGTVLADKTIVELAGRAAASVLALAGHAPVVIAFRAVERARKLGAVGAHPARLAVAHALEAGKEIPGARVVSMPCMEAFERQSDDYKESVLPSSCTKRIAMEAGVTGL